MPGPPSGSVRPNFPVFGSDRSKSLGTREEKPDLPVGFSEFGTSSRETGWERLFSGLGTDVDKSLSGQAGLKCNALSKWNISAPRALRDSRFFLSYGAPGALQCYTVGDAFAPRGRVEKSIIAHICTYIRHYFGFWWG